MSSPGGLLLRSAISASIRAPRLHTVAVASGRRYKSHESARKDDEPGTPSRAKFGFAFERPPLTSIDGVLMHTSKPLPGATAVLKRLNSLEVPHILLTNGGGRHETVRAELLSRLLDVGISSCKTIQSHTPFQDLVDGSWDVGLGGMADSTVFVTGSDGARCRAIMEAYGFKNVVTAADLLHADPGIFPFSPQHDTLANHKELPAPLWQPSRSDDAPALRFDAVFVLNDPRDWAVDIQIITDILLSDNGTFGKPPQLRQDGSSSSSDKQQPLLFFSNADLVWATSYHNARLGQGAFHGALAGVLARLGGFPQEKIHCIGKPTERMYNYASKALRAQGPPGANALERVYMIGDNCESDIKGANQYKDPNATEWKSILVRTGVWKESSGPPSHEPTVIVDNVEQAVDWALAQEGIRRNV